MKLSENIRFLRKSKNMTQEHIAKELGYKSFTTIQKWESGVAEPPIKKLQELAKLFNVDMNTLANNSISENVNKPKQEERLETDNSMIRLSLPILGSENQIGTYLFSDNVTIDFAFKVKDQSMVMARLLKGDIVFIRNERNIIDGKIYAIELGHEIMLKRLFFDKVNNILQLISENPAYKPLVYKGQDLNKINIIGQAIAFHSKVR